MNIANQPSATVLTKGLDLTLTYIFTNINTAGSFGMPKAYYHAIAFDFDGTLVDTMHEYARIASDEMSKIYSISAETAKQLYLETSGIPFFQQLDLIFGPDPRNEKCADNFETRKVKLFDTVKMDNPTRELLDYMRSLGLSLAITSNNFQELIDQFVVKVPGIFVCLYH